MERLSCTDTKHSRSDYWPIPSPRFDKQQSASWELAGQLSNDVKCFAMLCYLVYHVIPDVRTSAQAHISLGMVETLTLGLEHGLLDK